MTVPMVKSTVPGVVTARIGTRRESILITESVFTVDHESYRTGVVADGAASYIGQVEYVARPLGRDDEAIEYGWRVGGSTSGVGGLFPKADAIRRLLDADHVVLIFHEGTLHANVPHALTREHAVSLASHAVVGSVWADRDWELSDVATGEPETIVTFRVAS